jgi:hypothetical protein
MIGRRHGRQRTRNLLTGFLGIACFVAAERPAFSEEGSPAPSAQTPAGLSVSVPQPSPETPDASEGTPGMKVYIDPRTGRIVSEAPPGIAPLPLTPKEQSALSTSHQGLVQAPSSLPGGGVKLDLQGRFQSPLIATTDANGEVKIQHLGEQHDDRGSGDRK